MRLSAPALCLLPLVQAWRLDLNLLSHNIRYNATDLLPLEKPWKERAPPLISELRKRAQENPDSFLSVQEALHNQVQDILNGLNRNEGSIDGSAALQQPQLNSPEWAYIGVGRDDGREAGEYSPIFYRPSRFQLHNWTTYWLSPTPNKPSKGWDAGSIRIVTVGNFTHKWSNINFLALNTHLDNVGTISRDHSGRFIRALAKQYTDRGIPAWLTGDFNSPPDGEAYQLITATDGNSTLVDTKTLTTNIKGPNETYTGFDTKNVQPFEIDFIFVGPKEKSPWTVKGYEVLSNEDPKGFLFSDHRAVTVNLTLDVPDKHGY